MKFRGHETFLSVRVVIKEMIMLQEPGFFKGQQETYDVRYMK